MNKKELREVLDLVKEKLGSNVRAACGLFWPDCVTSYYAVNDYAVGECDPPCTTEYAVGECDEDPDPDVTLYSVGE